MQRDPPRHPGAKPAAQGKPAARLGSRLAQELTELARASRERTEGYRHMEENRETKSRIREQWRQLEEYAEECCECPTFNTRDSVRCTDRRSGAARQALARWSVAGQGWSLAARTSKSS